MKTLAEAAAEILMKTKSDSPAEPMKKLASGAEVVDLGGSTLDKPEGDEIGKKAAAVLSQAPAPGKGAAVAGDKTAKGLGGGASNPTAVAEEEEVSDEDVVTEVEASADETIEVDAFSEDSVEEIAEEEELTPEEIEEAKHAKVAMMRDKMKQLGVKEDIDAIFSGEDLSEEFKTKVGTVFEAAVIARAVNVVEEMEKEILSAAAQTIEEAKAQIEEQVDSYLNYMVEQWMEENKLAVTSGLKMEIAEEFMADIKNVFEAHNINLPEEQLDVMEAMVSENEELKKKLNDVLHSNIELKKEVNESKKNEIVTKVCEGLTATQAEKVKTLAEGVEFTTEREYSEKLKIIREQYFSSKVKTTAATPVVESVDPAPATDESAMVSPLMERYVRSIGKTLPR
jgi:hypothetical protein